MAWVCALACMAGPARASAAEGTSAFHVGMELSGFLLSSTYRDDAWSSLSAGADLRAEGTVSARLTANAHLAVGDGANSSEHFAAHVPAAYVAAGSARHELSLGRRRLRWSRMDESWELGIFNPRFLWNPLRPEPDALTGAFYRYESRRFRLSAFASGVTLPELGHSVAASDGRLNSSNPWFVPPPGASNLMGRDLGIAYSLRDPDIAAAVFRPSLLVRAEWGGDRGSWLSAAAGRLPQHQTDLALDAYFSLSDTRLHADLLPRFGMRDVAQLEYGYRTGAWDLWLSTLYESPERPRAPNGWITRPVGPAALLSAGADLRWNESIEVGASALWVREWARPDAGAASIPGAGAISLPGRFLAERALQLEAAWRSRRGRPEPSVRWLLDLEQSGGFLLGELSWRVGRWVTLSAGFEHPYARSTQGWFGAYREQDRVWGGISHEL